MITEQQLAAYLGGAITGEERTRFEQELATDEASLRLLADQERMDTALRFMAGAGNDREVVRQAIMAVLSGPSHEDVTDQLMESLHRLPPKTATAFSWRDWLRSHWPKMATGFAVFIVVTLVALRSPDQPVQQAKSPVTSPLAPVTTPRDPAKWPFAATSPWNTPIGSQAQYVAVNSAKLDLASGVFLKNSRLTHPLFVARNTDPSGRILAANQPVPLATTPIPAALLNQAGQWMTLLLVAEDGHTLYEIYEARREGANDVRGRMVIRSDLRGSGIPPELASANNAGLSPLAGSLYPEELSTGIHRAIGAIVPVDAINFRADGQAHVWPAGWSSGNQMFRSRFAQGGNVHLGTLLAIPADVDITTLGVGTNGPAFEFARAMQDYGVYVKDCFDPTGMTFWERMGSPNLIFCIDADPQRDLPPDLPAKLKLLTPHLKVVANNRANNVGGGGTPRRAPAPEFKTP